MGFRFSLRSANTVANLSFGKVTDTYREIFGSEQGYFEFRYFLETFQENYFTGSQRNFTAHPRSQRQVSGNSIQRLLDALSKFYDRRRFAWPEYGNEEYGANEADELRFDTNILKGLSDLSDIFTRCKIKALLLSGVRKPREENSDDFMSSPDILRRLAQIHPGNSCLILQPTDCEIEPGILNVFPHFETALRQAHLWPAVLFWRGVRAHAFVPVRSEDELFNLFLMIKYDKNPMDSLQREAARRNLGHHYLIQLSDLHFGARANTDGQRRIPALMKKTVEEMQATGTVDVLFTGDMVDSPTSENRDAYKDFEAELLKSGVGKTRFVWGNHDLDKRGLALTDGNRQIADLWTDFPKCEIMEDEKIVLLLFNSNRGGNFAQGEIGTEQLGKMGNLLDKIPNLSSYRLIAVLHHHVVPIPKPDRFQKTLFGSLIEPFLRLKDADIFLQWLKERGVKLVLHGHKHIPYITKTDDVNVVACGSSTGYVQMKKKGMTCLSYNVFDLGQDAVTCTQCVEEIVGGGVKNIRTEIFEI